MMNIPVIFSATTSFFLNELQAGFPILLKSLMFLKKLAKIPSKLMHQMSSTVDLGSGEIFCNCRQQLVLLINGADTEFDNHLSWPGIE